MNIKFILILIFSFTLSNFSFSAPPPPPGGGSPLCFPPPCVPIDGGITLLIAAGAILGGKKLMGKSNKM